MPGSSPFHYCFNNPLILRDPSGLIGEIGSDGIPRFTTGEVVVYGERDNSSEDVIRDRKLEWTAKRAAANAGDRVPRAQGGGEDPTYSYDGQYGLSSTDLYTSILIDKAAQQFGITDIAALGAAITGAPLLSTRGKFEGATKGTSIASKYLSKMPGKSPFPLPAITGYPRVLGGRGMRVMLTNVVGRFIGRAVPILGWGMLAYDIGMTFYETQVEYDRITRGGQ
jgi:hypothetical protein